MLTLYYAFLKTSALLLITINCFGIAIESIYLAMYMIYAPGRAKVLLIFATPSIIFW